MVADAIMKDLFVGVRVSRGSMSSKESSVTGALLLLASSVKLPWLLKGGGKFSKVLSSNGGCH